VIAAGLVLAFVARALVRRWLRRHEATLGPSFVRLAVTSVFYEIVALTIAGALVALGVPKAWVGALLLVLLLVLAIAFRESISDLAASVLFVIFRPFRRGDLIETLGQEGRVHEMLLFTTVLTREDGALVTLPNARIHEDGVANLSPTGRVLAQVKLSVPYDADLARVRELLVSAARDEPAVLAEPAPEVVVAELGEHGVDLVLIAAASPQALWTTRAGLRERCATGLSGAGIELGRVARLSIDDDDG